MTQLNESRSTLKHLSILGMIPYLFRSKPVFYPSFMSVDHAVRDHLDKWLLFLNLLYHSRLSPCGHVLIESLVRLAEWWRSPSSTAAVQCAPLPHLADLSDSPKRHHWPLHSWRTIVHLGACDQLDELAHHAEQRQSGHCRRSRANQSAFLTFRPHFSFQSEPERPRRIEPLRQLLCQWRPFERPARRLPSIGSLFHLSQRESQRNLRAFGRQRLLLQ